MRNKKWEEGILMKEREKRTKMKWNKSENEKDTNKKIISLIFLQVKTAPDLTESSRSILIKAYIPRSILSKITPLKPSGHYMFHQFNIQ